MPGYMPIIYILALVGAFVVCGVLLKLLFEPLEELKEKEPMSGIILSLEELKNVRDSYGYKLVKKPVRHPLKPCKCGCSKPRKVVTHDGFCYICPECHRRGDDGRTAKKRRENWNKMV